MTRQETEKLFRLIPHYFPQKQITDELMAAWYLAFRSYGYEAVRDAVIQHAMVKKFFPDISEVAKFLPPVCDPAGAEAEKRAQENGWMAPYIDELASHDRDPSASRLARERGISWKEAQDMMERGEA